MIDQPPSNPLPVPPEVPSLSALDFGRILATARAQVLVIDQREHVLITGITMEDWWNVMLTAEWAVKHYQSPGKPT
jgi:hypothetical protein